ncbi:MAG: cupredoxin domain-containing protein, partial [Gaiellaceae bacterium]
MLRTTPSALVASAAPVGAANGDVSISTFVGTVGPGFDIHLTKGGANLAKIAHGKVTIVVSDKSSIHDFHLTGPGVNKTTSIGGKGTTTWTVTLKPGTYKYVCDPHSFAMHGSFRVTYPTSAAWHRLLSGGTARGPGPGCERERSGGQAGTARLA